MKFTNVMLEETILLTQRIDYSGGTNAVYIGYARPGSDESDDEWLIHKLTYDSNDNMLAKFFADGSKSFDKAWTKRTGYTYA